MFAAVYALGSAHFPASALGAADLALDAVVEVGLRREARRLVHLEQPGPELRVDEHVEAEDLEAHGVPEVLGLAGVVHVRLGGARDAAGV